MRSREARDKFNEADRLYREKQYADALVVLDDLDKEFPDTKNVLYPRAMCLARVGRFDEALDLCRQLKVEFGDPRGEKLMGKVSALRKALVEKEKKKQAPVATTSAAPPPTIFTLDSNPPPVADKKNMEFSPVFNPGAAAPATPGSETSGGAGDVFDLGDGSPVIDFASGQVVGVLSRVETGWVIGSL